MRNRHDPGRTTYTAPPSKRYDSEGERAGRHLVDWETRIGNLERRPAGGGGIEFDVINDGGWLWINTTSQPSAPSFWSGISLWENGYGITINSYGGDVNEGEAHVDILGDDGISLTTDNSVASAFDGNIYIAANGFTAAVHIDSDNEFIVTSEGEMQLDIDGDVGIWSNTGSCDIGGYGGWLWMYGDTDIILDCSGSGNLKFDGLPTSSPGVTGAVWNDSGTLKIA